MRLLQGALGIMAVFRKVSVNTVFSRFNRHLYRKFQVCFRRTVCGRMQFFHQIVLELRQPIRNICQRIVRILLVIPLFILVLDFLRIPAPVSWWPVRHFALILKMSLMQPCFQRLDVHLLSTSHAIAMQRTNCFQNWRITLERQEVRNCSFSK